MRLGGFAYARFLCGRHFSGDQPVISAAGRNERSDPKSTSSRITSLVSLTSLNDGSEDATRAVNHDPGPVFDELGIWRATLKRRSGAPKGTTLELFFRKSC